MPATTTRRAALTLFAAPLLLATPALAAPGDDPLVARAIGYLDGLVSVKGRFKQSDEKGGEADGTFYLARPGRARFEYDAPSGLLITCDGRTVIVSDSQRKTFQRVALSSTPLAVFLSDHIRLDRGAQVTNVEHNADGFSITARGPNANEGQITLFFAERPLRLSGWAVNDAQGHLTRVTLGALISINPPPADFFSQTQP
ncbi:MAG TPA: outer membrane lipoprotein carrier protein LolA [Caulobacteraceae bacterium]|jgi:outer membrane lipoprotein-sorting protein|nr:outer membrane lipoprotein carrier protein LolA [Caulobacteraceae bacterium]